MKKTHTKNPEPCYVQLELLTLPPRSKKRESWPTPRGSCSRLRAAVLAATARQPHALAKILNVPASELCS